MRVTTTQIPCFCRAFEFGEFDGENENAVSYDTNCDQVTTRVFAQGHDAKLAGFLVRAEMAGEEIRMTDGGLAISSDALGMARKVSEAFEAKVAALLDVAKARVAKKALAEARKAAKASTKKAKAAEDTLLPIEAMIKVRGRWTYPAQIDRKTRWATYTKKNGETVSISTDSYEMV